MNVQELSAGDIAQLLILFAVVLCLAFGGLILIISVFPKVGRKQVSDLQRTSQKK